jgi:hypothetical protein
MLWQIVIKFSGAVWCNASYSLLGNLFSSNHAADFPIRALGSQDRDVNSILELRGHDLSLLEAKGTWEVLVKNGNLGESIISVHSWLSCNIWVVELHLEIEIWLPVRVVDNLNLHCLFSLTLLH